MCSLLPSKEFMATAQGPSSILRKRERERDRERGREREKGRRRKRREIKMTQVNTVLVRPDIQYIINVFQIVCMIVFLKVSQLLGH